MYYFFVGERQELKKICVVPDVFGENVFRSCRFLPLCREEDKENLGLRVAARGDVLTNCQPTVGK